MSTTVPYVRFVRVIAHGDQIVGFSKSCRADGMIGRIYLSILPSHLLSARRNRGN